MLPAGWLHQLLRFEILFDTIHEKEQRLTDLEQGALLDFAERSLNPNPSVRLQAVVQLEADYQLRDRLRQSLDHDQRQLAARLEGGSWLSRKILEEYEKRANEQSQKKELKRLGPGRFRSRAQGWLDGPLTEPKGFPTAAFWLISMVIWPVLWVVWAFLARGGISYRLAGIALVRGDGRSASRLQCAGERRSCGRR